MGESADIELRPVALADPDGDADALRSLLREYLTTLDPELSRRELQSEIDDLSAHYGGAGQGLWLACVDGAPAACAGIRRLADEVDANACEMRRLFVRPAMRGFGLGRRLAELLIDHARSWDYSAVYLDTLNDMAAARGLYESLGFEPVDPWYHDPLPGSHHFRLDLVRPGPRY